MLENAKIELLNERVQRLEEQLEAAEERYHAIENKALFHDDALARAKRAEEQLEAAQEEIRHWKYDHQEASKELLARAERAEQDYDRLRNSIAYGSNPASRPPADATPFPKPKMQQIGVSLPAREPSYEDGLREGMLGGDISGERDPASERLAELTADDDSLDWRVAKWTDPPNQDSAPASEPDGAYWRAQGGVPNQDHAPAKEPS